MEASSGIIDLVVIVAGCVSIAMFVVGIVIGRRAERHSQRSTGERAAAKQLIDQLRRLTESTGAKAAAADKDKDADRHVLPADVASLIRRANGGPPAQTSTNANRSHSIVTAVEQVVRRGVEAERKLAIALLHLDEQNQMIRHHASAARTDALTGLINRGAFDEALTRRTAEAGRTDGTLSLTLYDVDHFKQCNDHYGHQVGDKVLAVIAEVINHQVREMDIVARYGGEEFAVIMPTTAAELAVRGAERIRLAVSRTELPDNLQHLNLTISVGVAEFQVGDTPESLIARADQALYASKRAGRNRTSIHDGRTTRPVTPWGVVGPEAESWQNVAAELKAKLGQMSLHPPDVSQN